MNTAEISNGFQVRELLAESVRQARESAHLHSQGEILSFHKANRGQDTLSNLVPKPPRHLPALLKSLLAKIVVN